MEKQYKDSFCRPIVTDEGQPLAGGAARNYRISQFDGGLDELIEHAISSVHARIEAKQAIARASRSSSKSKRGVAAKV